MAIEIESENGTILIITVYMPTNSVKNLPESGCPRKINAIIMEENSFLGDSLFGG